MHWSHAAGISGTRWVRWLLVLAGVMGIAAGVIVLAEPALAAAGWLMIEPEAESETPRAGGPVAAT